jgi:hypothetical protein
VVIVGKADEHQLAYAGYKDNVESFLYATAMKAKVSISVGHVPVPTDFEPQVPLPMPKIVFKVAGKTTAETLARMKSGLEKFGLAEKYTGKGAPSYTLSGPTFNFIRDTLPKLALPVAASAEKYAQPVAATTALRLYQCVDLFLATNTYSYKPGGGETETISYTDSVGTSSMMEVRHGGSYFRPGYTADTKKMRLGEEREQEEGTRWAEDEERDMHPHMASSLGVRNAVLVAKPSPKPSSTSWGPPSSVPNIGGIYFPYFDGLLAHDTAGLRELVGELFFRNLGSSKQSRFDAFKTFRGDIGTYATTSAGIIMAHVLKGVKLALETQTQLYLILDNGVYHGFCLLGVAFKVFAHASWVPAMSPEDLRAELSEIRTKAHLIAALCEKVKECKTYTGDSIMVAEADLYNMQTLLEVLSSIDESDEDNKETVAEISKLLGGIVVTDSFLTFKPKNIVWALQHLANPVLPIDKDTPVYVPFQNWAKVGTRNYRILSAFGSRSFSFRNGTGKEIRVNTKSETSPFAEKDAEGKIVRDRLIIYEKAVSVCADDWAILVRRGHVKMEEGERAAGSRNHVLKDKDLTEVWDCLVDLRTKDQIGTMATEVVVPTKRKAAIEFEAADLSDLF